MTIDLIELFAILIIHWIADFVLQTHNQAMNKSKDINALLSHTYVYSFVWFIVVLLYSVFTNMHPTAALIFWAITLISHTATDYFTSRWTKKYFSAGNYHNGFVIVGLDQILHYVQLVLTRQLLI